MMRSRLSRRKDPRGRGNWNHWGRSEEEEVDEAQPSHPLATTTHLSNTTSKSTQPSPPSVIPTSTPSCHYTPYKSKRISLSPTYNQLSCDNRPFFEDLHYLSSNMNTFYNKVLAFSCDVFKKCSDSWTSNKKYLLLKNFTIVAKLEVYAVLDIAKRGCLQGSWCFRRCRGSRLQIDWLDRVRREIHKKGEDYEVIQNVQSLKRSWSWWGSKWAALDINYRKWRREWSMRIWIPSQLRTITPKSSKDLSLLVIVSLRGFDKNFTEKKRE